MDFEAQKRSLLTQCKFFATPEEVQSLLTKPRGGCRSKKNSFYLGSQQRLKVHIPFSLQTLICIHNWKRRQQLFWQQKYCIQNWKSQLVKQHFLFCKQDIPTPHMINRPVVGQCAWRCQKFWPHNQYEISLCSCITEKQIVCLCCSIICEGVYIHQFNVGSLDDLGRDLTRVVQFSENPNFPIFICLTWKTKNVNVENSLKIVFFPEISHPSRCNSKNTIAVY